MRRVRFVVVALALVLGGAPLDTRALTAAETKAATAALSRFETLLFIAGELASGRTDPERLVAEDAIRAPLAWTREALELAAPGASGALLGASTSVVVGAKDFRAPVGPRGLGGVQSTMCFVFVLRPGAKFDARSVLRSVARSDGAVPVWRWQGPRGEGDPEVVEVFATPAGSSFFVVGNNLEEILALVGALGRATDKVPAALAKAGLMSEPAWAYRRYQHAQADPTAAGTAKVAPGAEALVVVPAAGSMTVRLLGSMDDSAAKRLSEGARLPPFARTKPGVWQTTVPVKTRDEPTAAAFLSVLYLLGFGLYL
jgi:hypothetical protein